MKTLEYAIPVDNNQTGWFYYHSGLKMEYAPAAEPGKHIQQISDDKGNDIDPNKQYSIAVMEGSVPANLISACERTGILIPEL